MSKILVAYFSASGETARLAKTLAGGDGGGAPTVLSSAAISSKFVPRRPTLQPIWTGTTPKAAAAWR